MIKKRVHWPKVKNVHVKSKDSMSPFLGHQCWYSFNDTTPFPGAEVKLTRCVCVFFFFFFKKNKTLKECIPDLLSALCSVCVCVCVSHSVVSDSLWPHGLYSPLGSSIHGILQAWILEWVAIPFSRGSSQPRDRISVCIADRLFTIWATREATRP